jgi:hypothetical protein
MDDKFLYQNRPPVRPGFGENLYSHISSLPLQKETSKTILRFGLRFALAVMVLFAALFTFSQPVRASVLYWIKQIAGLEVQEEDYIPFSESESISIPPDVRDTLANIAQDLPYELAIPAYVPNGFTFDDKVEVQDTQVFMRWLNSDRDEILMLVDTDHGQRYITGTDAGQEIHVNEQPALLVQGNYDMNGNWDSDQKMMNLIQRRDDVIYWLVYVGYSENEFDCFTIQAELVGMMGSLKE